MIIVSKVISLCHLMQIKQLGGIIPLFRKRKGRKKCFRKFRNNMSLKDFLLYLLELLKNGPRKSQGGSTVTIINQTYIYLQYIH